MKKMLMTIALALLGSMVCHAQDSGKLENSALVWQWNLAAGKLTSTLDDRADGTALTIQSEPFQLVLGDGRIVKASDFKLAGAPRTDELPADAASPTLARHFIGRQLTLVFTDEPDHLTATWQAEMRDGATYLQQQLTLKAGGGDALIKEIILFDQTLLGAKTVGVVDGSPVVAGTFFCGYEHPMAQNAVTGNNEVQCHLVRNAVLKDGESLVQRFVLGVAAPGQMRRGFLAYVERARAHPYRPFLHYNSWFDIAWDRQKYDEAQSLDVIHQFGQQMVQQRGVKMDSFLFDDGWDDNQTLWKFHSGFPDGFTPLKKAAAGYDAGIGVWVSPFGGYDLAKVQRLQYASRFGYETNDSGFSLAGPKYYQRFHDICLEMVQKYGVNQFKFDGLAAGAKANEAGLTRDGDAMLRLVEDLRAVKPNIYINQTTGTWPSPFWLLSVDSTWRGGADHDFQGQGSWCQQWMTYRDAETYDNVVTKAPLYPLNSLMLHGIIYAKNASHLTAMSDADFADQAREFFGNGTQLQELYLTPALLNRQNWDDLAEAAKWSRRNADVLVDTHWIGGDPGKDEVYGWAAWSPHKAILVLRNPAGRPATFAFDAARLFELPAGAREKYVMHSPWKQDHAQPDVSLQSGEPHTFELQPFAVLVLEEKKRKMNPAVLETGQTNSISVPAKGIANRVGSIDAFRGFVMLLMMTEALDVEGIAKNFPGSNFWAFLSHQLSHSQWVGCSLFDLIQPGFSFLVGVALPFSLARRIIVGQPQWQRTLHAFGRALVLILLGVFLRSLDQPQTFWTFKDTLSQIGFGYGFLYLLALRSVRVQWVALTTILISYWLFFALCPLPGSGFDWSHAGTSPDQLLPGFSGHWSLNTNPAWSFDVWFLNLFPQEHPFMFADDGGYSTLSFIPTLGTMILGLIVGGVLRSERSPFGKMRWLVVAGLIGLAAGWLLGALGICPVVKRIWTPSWVLFSGGWCLLILAGLYLIMDIRNRRAWAFPFKVAGMNSIAAYMMSWLFVSFISDALLRHLGHGVFDVLGQTYQPLLLGAGVMLVEWLILWWMYRRKIFLRI